MIVRLADCRPRDAYQQGHVPGAVHLDPERDLTGEIGDASRGRHPLPDVDEFAAAATRAGIGSDVFVLAYDDGTGWASRCWWLLRHFGHNRAGNFDLRHYQGPSESGDRPLRDLPPVAPFRARPRNDDTIEAEELRARLGDPDLLVLDARSQARWRGDEEPLDPVAGRIPGARNAFFEKAVPEEAFSAPELAVYCGSGVTAAVQVQRLVLAGREDVRLYPGSFSEWCRRNGYPIEKGDP
jgi:thiosulfate/3-mercaptopyruvate sulfurtransferase